MSCWICGSSENLTGEHIFKHSDAKLLVGKISQSDPAFFNSSKHENLKVGSFKGNIFKFKKIMCAKCNNSTTQPYDMAWETASDWFFNNGKNIKAGDKFRWSAIFPYRTKFNMVDVQLFFTKLMGCCLEEAGLKFDKMEFSKSLLERKINPSIFLKINVSENPSVGVSDLVVQKCLAGAETEEAAWSYQIGKIHIHVFYLHDLKIHKPLRGEWHPKQNSNVTIVQKCL